MNRPEDFVALSSMTGGITSDSVTRYVCSVAKELEQRFDKCPHCGTKLKPWDPAVFENGVEVGRQKTDHMWCTNCLCVTYNYLLGILGIPKNFWA